MRIKLPLITLLLLLLAGPRAGWADGNEIYILKVSSAIGPGIADFIRKGIKQANDENGRCIIIELDTPGGLVDSMRQIVMDIFGSRIPVLVFVSPSGARAASAGVMITLAADIAAMAPGTNIGAAHPVGAGGKEIGKTMSDKVLNDMVAYVKSIAQRRAKNVQWAEEAVRESVSVPETEALKNNIIDIIAKDTDDLIRQVNGRQIKDKGVLDLENATRKIIREGLRTKILKTISDPNIAYILMMIGLAGIYFELSHPGSIFPGVIGGISLVLAFFSFQTLPVNYAGVLLIVLALIFFIMEMKITSYGLLSVAGVISLLLGSLMLFEDIPAEWGLKLRVLLPTVALVSGFFIFVAALVFQAQVRRPKTGAEGLVGTIGVVREAINPQGKVFVHSELWNATSREPIEINVKVIIKKVDNLMLEVEPADVKP